MTRSRRSSRRPCCASSASARPRSASSERSWNSSNRPPRPPRARDHRESCRVNTPSVTTSTRVRFETRLCRRTRRPIVSPTFSPKRRGHAGSGGAGGETARLEQQQALALGPRLVEQRERRARRLARAWAARPARRLCVHRARRAAQAARRRSAEGRMGSDFIARIEDRGSTRNAFACRIDEPARAASRSRGGGSEEKARGAAANGNSALQ